MSVILDVPYKEWSIIFKPQNLIFFVLPLEYAFAFKWWLLIILLILSCYWFMLELFPKKILRAVLVSVFVGLSPMFFWWYQSITILPVAYSFLIMASVMRLVWARTRRERLLLTLLLTYATIGFGLLLYPPFQIPCFIIITVFLLAWFLENYSSLQSKKDKLKVIAPYVLFCFITTLIVGSLFYVSRRQVIDIINNTVYPGTRVITAGGPSPLLSLSSFLSPNLQYDNKAAEGYLANQSEASNFIFIATYLVLPSIYSIWRAKQKHNKILWGLLFMNLLILIGLMRMYVSMPVIEPVYRIFLLDKVPNTRLLLGLGLAGVLQLILLMKAYGEVLLSARERLFLAVIAGTSSLITMLWVGIYTIENYPVFIASIAKVAVFAAWITAGIVLILYKRFTLGLLLLISFSFLSVYRVNPLYRGLGPLTNDSPIVSRISRYPPDKNWAVLQDRLLINFPAMAGKPSLNSVHFYPQLKLWRSMDPTGYYEPVYNRYAHIVMTVDEQVREPFTLKHADLVLVKFDPCNQLQNFFVTYILTPQSLQSECVQLQESIELPSTPLHIYKVTTTPS